MTNEIFPISKKDFRKFEPDFRIEAIIADGMWYSLTKWRKLAKVSEAESNKWIDEKLKAGELVQSPTGAKSFRYPYEKVLQWHAEQGLEVGDQIVDFIFPARVWDGKTEVEGFEEAPLREIGVVTFECSADAAETVTEALRGIARVREVEPGKFKAYCLSADYIKPIIQEIFKSKTVAEFSRVYSRSSSYRREMVDFSEDFAHHLIQFYKGFAKSLVKREMETIRVYIPDAHDQESQIITWVITAIEKFDEASSVPFSGYLNSVLHRWPYDLPHLHLGKDLSMYQRSRAKAIARLRAKSGVPDGVFSAEELASEIGISNATFADLEEKHQIWMKTKSATTLAWGDNGEDKSGEQVMGHLGQGNARHTDVIKANALSVALLDAALESRKFDDAFMVISHMGLEVFPEDTLHKTSKKFTVSLARKLGMI